MNRILSIPSEQLHPGDRIVCGLAYPAEVIEPGVIERTGLGGRTYKAVCLRLNGRAMALSTHALGTVDIDRPNLVIPGLES
jgi:hypothetical protein